MPMLKKHVDTMNSENAASPPLLDARHALFLDFDGTLAELAQRPDAVRVASGLSDQLAQLCTQLVGAVAVVTGLRLSEVDGFLEPLQLIGAGPHGAEVRRSCAGDVGATVEPLPPQWRSGLRQQLTHLPGVWMEDKSFGVAIIRASSEHG